MEKIRDKWRFLGDRRAGPVGGAFEEGDQFACGIGGADLVEGRLVAEVYLFGLYDQQVAVTGGTGKRDGNVEGYTDDAMGVTGEGQGAVGRGKEYAAMCRVKSVQHLVIDTVVEFAITWSDVVDGEAQPF